METALQSIRLILENHQGMAPNLPPRVYFSEFNRDSLGLVMIYWYSPPDYWKYMEFSERTNLSIMKIFEQENINFAIRSSTAYLENPNGRSTRIDTMPRAD